MLYYILIFLLILLYLFKNNYENFWDIVPYKYSYNMFKCFDSDCLLRNSYICYKYCDVISEPGAKGRCRQRCSDYADIQADVLKFNNYNWNIILPKWSKYALFNKKDPDVFIL